MDWKARIRAAAEPSSLPDDDVIEELAEHAAADYQAALADGAPPADAARRVETQVAGWIADPAVRRRRPRGRDVDVIPPVATSRLVGLAHDLRQAFRLLRRQPGYAAIAALTMALGVGAATALFSVAYGVLLKPLPWPDAGRLVRLYETRHASPSRFGPLVTNATYIPWRERSTTIDAIAAWSGAPMTLADAGEPLRVRVALTTADLFPMLGVRPVLGTLFSADDEPPGRERKALLSYGVWQERFGGDPQVIRRTIRLDGEQYRVVGVLPRSCAFPDRDTRIWIPFQVPRPVAMKGGGALSMFQALARLRPGVTPAQAAAEGTARARTSPDPGMVAVAVFGANGPIDVSVVPLLETQTAAVRPAILVFLAAVGLLLLTATASVASVQLARAASRQREIAVRSALGAGTGRLARQFVIEGLLLGLCGGIVGLLLAAGIGRALPALLPPAFPRLDDVTLDLRVAAFAIGISLACSIAFGVLPALHARKLQIAQALCEDGTAAPIGGGIRSRTARTRTLIMCGQVAIACVLLVGTALLTRSFVALTRADRGYDVVNVLTARLAMPDGAYTNRARAALMTAILDRVRALPGVTRAAFTSALPLTRGDTLGSFTMVSPTRGTIQAHSAIRLVSSDYFAALGLRVVRGRAFTDADSFTAERVVVVNRAFAEQYLSDRAIGDQVPFSRQSNDVATARVVGVVDNVHHKSVTDPPAPEIYHSYLQRDDGVPYEEPTLVVRTAGEPAHLVAALRSIVRGQDPSLAFDSIRTMSDLFSSSLAQPRLYAVLLATFAGFAVTIAAVGLFGVLGYGVAQRSREIGVRTALGARPFDIVAIVLRQGFGIALAGLTVGLGVAFAAAKSLSTFLYGVTPYDTLSFAVVPVVLLLVTAAACVVPARRAARIDPARVLR